MYVLDAYRYPLLQIKKSTFTFVTDTYYWDYTALACAEHEIMVLIIVLTWEEYWHFNNPKHKQWLPSGGKKVFDSLNSKISSWTSYRISEVLTIYKVHYNSYTWLSLPLILYQSSYMNYTKELDFQYQIDSISSCYLSYLLWSKMQCKNTVMLGQIPANTYTLCRSVQCSYMGFVTQEVARLISFSFQHLIAISDRRYCRDLQFSWA